MLAWSFPWSWFPPLSLLIDLTSFRRVSKWEVFHIIPCVCRCTLQLSRLASVRYIVMILLYPIMNHIRTTNKNMIHRVTINDKVPCVSDHCDEVQLWSVALEQSWMSNVGADREFVTILDDGIFWISVKFEFHSVRSRGYSTWRKRLNSWCPIVNVDTWYFTIMNSMHALFWTRSSHNVALATHHEKIVQRNIAKFWTT